MQFIYGMGIDAFEARAAELAQKLKLAQAEIDPVTRKFYETADSVGQAFGAWKEYIDAVVSAGIALLVGGVALVVLVRGALVDGLESSAEQRADTGAELLSRKPTATEWDQINAKLQKPVEGTGDPCRAPRDIPGIVHAAAVEFGIPPGEFARVIFCESRMAHETPWP